jgi:hypothetical protein
VLQKYGKKNRCFGYGGKKFSIIFQRSWDIFIHFCVEFQANPGKKLCGKLDGLGKTTITVWRAAAAAAAFYFAKSR